MLQLLLVQQSEAKLLIWMHAHTSGLLIISLKIQSTALPATHSNTSVLPQAVECCLKLKTTYVFKVPDLSNKKNVHKANSNVSRGRWKTGRDDCGWKKSHVRSNAHVNSVWGVLFEFGSEVLFGIYAFGELCVIDRSVKAQRAHGVTSAALSMTTWKKNGGANETQQMNPGYKNRGSKLASTAAANDSASVHVLGNLSNKTEIDMSGVATEEHNQNRTFQQLQPQRSQTEFRLLSPAIGYLMLFCRSELSFSMQVPPVRQEAHRSCKLN
jgi:hypothetical protein